MAATPYAQSSRGTWQYRSKLMLVYLVLALVIFVTLYPAIMMVLNSFKSNNENNVNPGGLPQAATLENYAEIFKSENGIWLNFVNSVIISVISTFFAVFLAALAAFAFAKFRFWGRDVIFAMLLATIMVPTEITIPPLYLLFAKIGWLNTYQVQILPTITSVFGLFMMRQYMATVPNALLDAARIDGANHWQTFWRIMLPISSPVLGAFSILHFLSIWNSYLWPLVVASDSAVKPIMVVLPDLRDPVVGYAPIWGTVMAGCVLATLPIIIVFIVFQDKFMAGVVVGAVKE